MNTGGYYSLKSYGAQDAWVKDLPEDAFNLEVFLKDKHYQRVYQKLKIKNYKKHKNEHGSLIHVLTLDLCCHLIHKVDAYFKTTEKLNRVLKSVEVIYGGQRFDKICCEDIETVLAMNAAILKSNRKVVYTDTTTIVPLLLAPFHDINLIPPQLAYHNLVIQMETTMEEDIDLYADCYYIQDYKYTSRECLTVQTNDWEKVSLTKGVNTIKLYFNHPMICIYVWGFDKKHIKNITLKLNIHKMVIEDTIFYSGGIEPLEYYKQTRGITEDPVCIFFSDVELNKRPNSTVNFSRLDDPVLILEVEEESPCYIVGLSYQGYKYENGMAGLRFSK